LLPTLNIFKHSKIELIQFILESLIKIIERDDMRTGVKVDEDQALTGSMGCNFEESVGGFVEGGNIFESGCFS
jgi:hypothetical protein